ncbi:MAG: heavy metal-binding domain-containing protein [Candidatus Tenebribacter davisii]|nr:heavy metal-binding domain-containing protein [Candidatus Tenebribacter davisii]
MILFNKKFKNRKINEILDMVKGHTIYAIWLGNDLSALVRLVLGGELIEYTAMMEVQLSSWLTVLL